MAKTQYIAGVMASSSVWRTASMREEIMDKLSCFLKTFAEHGH